jgi:hypothetical protein
VLKLEDPKAQTVRLHVSEIKPVMEQSAVKTPLGHNLDKGYTILNLSHSMVMVHIKTDSINGAKMVNFRQLF